MKYFPLLVGLFMTLSSGHSECNTASDCPDHRSWYSKKTSKHTQECVCKIVYDGP